MNSLRELTQAFRAQRLALSEVFAGLEVTSYATAAGALFDVIVAEVDALIGGIERGDFVVGAVAADYKIDEGNLEPVLGKEFVKRLSALQDLSSTLVEQFCNAADQITNEARAELGLPRLVSGKSAPDGERAQRASKAENKAQLRAHAREYLGVSLRDYACALENMLETLQNMLTGAALLSLAGRMSAPVVPESSAV